jgi:hypothetical protein
VKRLFNNTLVTSVDFAVLIVLNLATIGSFVYLQWKDSRTAVPGPSDIAPPVPPDRLRAIDREKRAELRRLLVELHGETADIRGRIGALEAEALRHLERDPVPRDSLETILDQTSALQREVSRHAVDKLIEAKIHLDTRQQRVFFRMILRSRPDRQPGFGHPPRGQPRPDRDGHRRGGRI